MLVRPVSPSPAQPMSMILLLPRRLRAESGDIGFWVERLASTLRASKLRMLVVDALLWRTGIQPF